MAHAGDVLAPVPAAEREEMERRRYLKKMSEQEGLKKFSPEQAVREGVDVVPHKTVQPPQGPRPDIPPGIISSAHISTAMQGSTYPGFLDTRFRAKKRQLYPWKLIRRALDYTRYPNVKDTVSIGDRDLEGARPFVTGTIPGPRAGLGDANTDELLQRALKSYLMKGELQEKNLLEFSRDRPWRGN